MPGGIVLEAGHLILRIRRREHPARRVVAPSRRVPLGIGLAEFPPGGVIRGGRRVIQRVHDLSALPAIIVKKLRGAVARIRHTRLAPGGVVGRAGGRRLAGSCSDGVGNLPAVGVEACCYRAPAGRDDLNGFRQRCTRRADGGVYHLGLTAGRIEDRSGAPERIENRRGGDAGGVRLFRDLAEAIIGHAGTAPIGVHDLRYPSGGIALDAGRVAARVGHGGDAVLCVVGHTRRVAERIGRLRAQPFGIVGINGHRTTPHLHGLRLPECVKRDLFD